MTTDTQTPLWSDNAEQAVLGDVLYRSSNLFEVADTLDVADFYHKQHRAIYAACLALGDRTDPLSVQEHIGDDDLSGGMAYLAGLARDALCIGHVRHYAERVIDYSRRRKLAALGHEMVAMSTKTSAEAVIDHTQTRLTQMDEDASRGDDVFSLGSVADAWIDELDERCKHDGGIIGLPTGIKKLDTRLRGLCKGRLYVVAGRPAMGKSIVGLRFALSAALAGHRSLVVSLEMPRTEIMSRVQSALSRIDLDKFESGTLTAEELDIVTQTMGQINPLPMYVSDGSRLSITSLEAKAKRHQRRHGLDLLVVDYLQLLEGRGENRTQQIGDISRGLKRLAMELNIPVVALSQLNRGVEQRQDKRPVLSDLRESGDVEQDADVVLMLYRDEVYHPDSDRAGVLEILIRKFRSGEPGLVEAAFLGRTADVGDLTYQPPPATPARQYKGFEL